MKTFNDYLLCKEDGIQGVSGNDGNDEKTEQAFAAAMEAFEIVLSKNPDSATAYLNSTSESIPEVKTILQKFGLDSFKDVGFKKSSHKPRRVISKGLAEVRPEDMKDGTDVVSAPEADSYHNPIG